MSPLDLYPTAAEADAWPVWGTTALLVVNDPRKLRPARALVDATLADVDRACSRFRADSELMRHPPGVPALVSPLLAALIRTALRVAEQTGGTVDPTVGGSVAALGYDRDLSGTHRSVPAGRRVWLSMPPGWHTVRLTGDVLTVPRGVLLDLGAIGKAFAVDLCAQAVADGLGVGVLVGLGGDFASAGDAPPGGWRVRVQDSPDDPATRVLLPAGAALATSSTMSRTWRRGRKLLHHIVDPTTGLPARRVWRSATVVARDCVTANACSTAAVVRGMSAPRLLAAHGVSGRLVSPQGRVRTVGSWPPGQLISASASASASTPVAPSSTRHGESQDRAASPS